jgi:ribose transport system substrate-binding protein
MIRKSLVARLNILILCVLWSAFVTDGCAQTQASLPWDGPTVGPVAKTGKKILFISANFKNGGISSAYRGFYSAAIKLGWDVSLIDGKNDKNIIQSAFAEAIRSHRDAIILGGFGIEGYEDVIEQARQSGLILAGWHAAEKPGPTKELFVNISTATTDVAKIAVEYAIANGSNDAGFVIFNDNRYAIANAKTKYMQELIQKCVHCKLLGIENIPISEASAMIPEAVTRLNREFGKKWTHTLAINDIYFDSINYPLVWNKRLDIVNVAAGDGSRIAIDRVMSGRSQQIATVAEPTNLQGWQLADELNRAFSKVAPSGYVSKPILITVSKSKQALDTDIDSNIPYEAAYIAIWKGQINKK